MLVLCVVLARWQWHRYEQRTRRERPAGRRPVRSGCPRRRPARRDARRIRLPRTCRPSWNGARSRDRDVRREPGGRGAARPMDGRNGFWIMTPLVTDERRPAGQPGLGAGRGRCHAPRPTSPPPPPGRSPSLPACGRPRPHDPTEPAPPGQAWAADPQALVSPDQVARYNAYARARAARPTCRRRSRRHAGPGTSRAEQPRLLDPVAALRLGRALRLVAARQPGGTPGEQHVSGPEGPEDPDGPDGRDAREGAEGPGGREGSDGPERPRAAGPAPTGSAHEATEGRRPPETNPTRVFPADPTRRSPTGTWLTRRAALQLTRRHLAGRPGRPLGAACGGRPTCALSRKAPRSSGPRGPGPRSGGAPRRPGCPSTGPRWSCGDVAVRHEDRAHPDLLGAVHVVPRPVADEDRRAPGRRPPRASQRRDERVLVRLADRQLGGVDGPVDQVAAGRRARTPPRGGPGATACWTGRRPGSPARAGPSMQRDGVAGRRRCAGPRTRR